MAPGAHTHANIAIRTHLSPVFKAGFCIQFPSAGPIDHCLVIEGYGIGRTANGALLTYFAEVLNADINRFVRSQRNICGYSAQSNSGPELLCN